MRISDENQGNILPFMIYKTRTNAKLDNAFRNHNFGRSSYLGTTLLDTVRHFNEKPAAKIIIKSFTIHINVTLQGD